MNRKGILVALAVSLGLAYLASALVKSGGFKFGKTNVREVLVAAQDIPERQVLNEKLFVKREIPEELYAANMVTSMDRPSEFFAHGTIIKGEILYQSRLGLVSQEPELSYMVDRTQGVITIGVTTITGVAGILKPGDHVDVFATYDYKIRAEGDKGGGKEMTEAATKKIVSRCRVIAVGKEVLTPVKGRAPGQFGRQRVVGDIKHVTLAVGDREMERIIYAHTNGKIHLVLLSEGGKTEPDRPGYGTPDMGEDLFTSVEEIRANNRKTVRVER